LLIFAAEPGCQFGGKEILIGFADNLRCRLAQGGAKRAIRERVFSREVLAKNVLRHALDKGVIEIFRVAQSVLGESPFGDLFFQLLVAAGEVLGLAFELAVGVLKPAVGVVKLSVNAVQLADCESYAHQQEQAKEQQQSGKVGSRVREKPVLLGFDNVFETWPGLQGSPTTGRCRELRVDALAG